MKFFLLSENERTERRFCVLPERDLIAQEEAASGGCAKAPGVKGESPALRDVWTDRCHGREPRGTHVSIIAMDTLYTQANCRASSLSSCPHSGQQQTMCQDHNAGYQLWKPEQLLPPNPLAQKFYFRKYESLLSI